jgi:hypothetical protein
MNLFGQAPPGLQPLPFLLLFLLGWCGITVSISLVGGWHALAKKYRLEKTSFHIEENTGEKRFRCASMAIGPAYFPTHYGNCLTIGVSSRGILLRAWPLLRLMHPPLMIPWSDVEKCEMASEYLIFKRTSIYVCGTTAPLRFYGRAGTEIFSAWSRRQAAIDRAK